MAKTSEHIRTAIANAKLVEGRLRLFIPNHGPFEKRVSVIVDLGAGPKFVQCEVSDYDLEKRLLHVIDPRLKRRCLRPARVRAAMDSLIDRVRALERKTKAKKPRRALQEKAMEVVRKRQEDFEAREYQRGVESIRHALTGPAKYMELDDLIELWRRCNVEAVMES